MWNEPLQKNKHLLTPEFFCGGRWWVWSVGVKRILFALIVESTGNWQHCKTNKLSTHQHTHQSRMKQNIHRIESLVLQSVIKLKNMGKKKQNDTVQCKAQANHSVWLRLIPHLITSLCFSLSFLHWPVAAYCDVLSEYLDFLTVHVVSANQADDSDQNIAHMTRQLRMTVYVINANVGTNCGDRTDQQKISNG